MVFNQDEYTADQLEMANDMAERRKGKAAANSEQYDPIDAYEHYAAIKNEFASDEYFAIYDELEKNTKYSMISDPWSKSESEGVVDSSSS